jgi:hypothetical protein
MLKEGMTNMTDSVLIGLSIAGGIITVVAALIGLGFNAGAQSSRIKQNTCDIRDLKKADDDIKVSFLLGQKEVSGKMDEILKAVNKVCERVSTIEGGLDK